MAVYDDSIAFCPICHARLTQLVMPAGTRRQAASRDGQGENADPAGTARERESLQRRVVRSVARGPGERYGEITATGGRTSTPPQFETHDGRRYVFRGRVAEVNSLSRYHNRFHKVVNTVVQGEPYQFGHTSFETVIRVEEFTDGRLASMARDLVMYGDIEGTVQVGDDVTVHADIRRGRYVVRSLHNETIPKFV